MLAVRRDRCAAGGGSKIRDLGAGPRGSNLSRDKNYAQLDPVGQSTMIKEQEISKGCSEKEGKHPLSNSGILAQLPG